MLYKVRKYQNRYDEFDAESKKRFDLIEKLSESFEKEHSTARQLDDVLAELLELQFDSSASSSSTPVPVATNPEPVVKKTRTKRKPSGNLEEEFNAFMQQFNNISLPAGNSNIDIENALNDALHNRKIGFDDLDSKVQRMVSAQPQLIQYALPNVKTSTFPKPDVQAFQAIVDDLMLGNNVFLVGGAGTGKTYMAENLLAAKALSREHITINCSQWTSPTEIIGGQTMDGYQEGKLIEAWSKGYVLILDELPKIDPNTAGLLNDALAKSKLKSATIFNGRRESFKKHDNFAVIATGNIYPDKESVSYGANNKQDLSLLDRFSGSVYFIEKNTVLEMAILQNRLVWSVCDKIRSVIEKNRYEAQLSLRFMITARDAYDLEMMRVKEKGKNGIKAEEGKTFKQAIDSYISTFTEVQQSNIKTAIMYSSLIGNYSYREHNAQEYLIQ